jgi:hypothetical protein
VVTVPWFQDYPKLEFQFVGKKLQASALPQAGVEYSIFGVGRAEFPACFPV